MTHRTFAQRQAALRLGHRRLSERPPNLGLSSDSVAYRTHAPVIAQHRDSDALQRSNFAVVRDDLLDRFEYWTTGHSPQCGHPAAVAAGASGALCDCPPDVVVETFRHWAVGWTETWLVRVDAQRVRSTDLIEPTRAWLAAVEWLEALEAYPVADENHLGDLEYEEAWSYVADELDGPEGGWTEAVWQRLLEDSSLHLSELSHRDIEQALAYVWATVATEAVRVTREWLSLRQAGDGQITLEGETVRVSAEPPQSLSELEQLDPEDIEAPMMLDRLLQLSPYIEGPDGYELDAQMLLADLRAVTEALSDCYV